MKKTITLFISLAAVLFVCINIVSAEKAREGQVMFESAEDALKELKSSLKKEDKERLVEMFGPRSKKLFITGDAVNDAVTLRRLSLRFEQRAELLQVSSEEYSKELWYLVRYGIEGWDMHIPLVNRGKGWFFATEYGTIADLRVRRSLNEVAAIDTLQALLRAQKEYIKSDWNDDGVYEYASRFISTEGNHDGLYWPTKDGSPESPLDGIVARAIKDGYEHNGEEDAIYGGYIYKILTEQDGKTPGGKKSYLKDGKLVKGFAILAYPVKWNVDGDSTFIIGSMPGGQVWKRDFGSRTVSIASEMKAMKLDNLWLRADPHLGGENSRSNW